MLMLLFFFVFLAYCPFEVLEKWLIFVVRPLLMFPLCLAVHALFVMLFVVVEFCCNVLCLFVVVFCERRL